MSEIQANNQKQKGFKGKRLSTRVDLTPMVDLGFLLITFFIFTTAFAKPTVMKLVLPDDTTTSEPLKASEEKTLTILIAKSNRIYWYPGTFKDVLYKIDFKQLRDVIIQKRQELLKRFGSSKVTILIKPSKEATYENIVDSLDEMMINGVSTYMLVELEAKELEAIQSVI